MSGKPEALESVLSRLLGTLGLPSPDLLPRLRGSWDDLAGPPWAGQSRPVLIRRGELLVESNAPQLVSILRYASGELLRRLDTELGPGKIETIRVAPPRR
ncbi:MAG: DciA family protein [Acidimicrobiia bacterium]